LLVSLGYAFVLLHFQVELASLLFAIDQLQIDSLHMLLVGRNKIYLLFLEHVVDHLLQLLSKLPDLLFILVDFRSLLIGKVLAVVNQRTPLNAPSGVRGAIHVL